MSLRFSVITPSLRQLDWLELCTASVADQNAEVEHVVQDAGTPGIEGWAARHPGVQVFVEKDAGMYDAVNRGLRRATGGICSYLNCDEQYLPGTLRRVGDFFQGHPEIDVLFGDAVVADSSLRSVAYRRVVPPTRWHTLLRPPGIFTCSTFFRRRLIDENLLFDPEWKIIGDKAWLLALLERGYRLAVLPEPLALFAVTGTNLSLQPQVRVERLRWEKGIPPLIRGALPLVLGRYLLEKWRRGAYERHPLDSAWYTPASLPVRRRFGDLTLGWKWSPMPSARRS